MTESDEIMRYLLLEMDEAERGSFEERIFADDALFFEVSAAENELVDRFVRGRLEADDAARFEATFEQLPGRRPKLASAVALRSLIDDERAEDLLAAAAARPGFWQKISASLGVPAFGLAAGSLTVLLLAAMIFLVVERGRRGTELAVALAEKERVATELERLRKERTDTNELDAIREQFDREHEAVGDLARETEQKNRRIEQLERKLAERNTSPVPKEVRQRSTVTVTIPAGRPDEPSVLSAGGGTERIVVRIPLPPSVGAIERLNVDLNGKRIATGLSVRAEGAERVVTVTVPVSALAEGTNRLTIFNAAGSRVAEHSFTGK